VRAVIVDADCDRDPEDAVRTVLVVEDEVLTRMAVADMLRDSGLRVIEAGNADEAMAYVRGGGPVDLVFTDIEMPGAMNGAELGRRLRAEFPRLKLILTSGGLRRPEAALGASFVAKPYDFAGVAARIQAALTEPDRD
jgi:CheY-like chemotaxis protein